MSCIIVGLISLYILKYIDAAITLWERITRGHGMKRLEVIQELAGNFFQVVGKSSMILMLFDRYKIGKTSLF